MTGQCLFEMWTRQHLWVSLHPAHKERWDRLAAEVVPISEVAAWLRTGSLEATAADDQEAADVLAKLSVGVEARFAPGTGEEKP